MAFSFSSPLIYALTLNFLRIWVHCGSLQRNQKKALDPITDGCKIDLLIFSICVTPWAFKYTNLCDCILTQTTMRTHQQNQWTEKRNKAKDTMCLQLQHFSNYFIALIYHRNTFSPQRVGEREPFIMMYNGKNLRHRSALLHSGSSARRLPSPSSCSCTIVRRDWIPAALGPRIRKCCPQCLKSLHFDIRVFVYHCKWSSKFSPKCSSESQPRITHTLENAFSPLRSASFSVLSLLEDAEPGTY